MKLLVTAGPTREPIDAVRFISNRSSGRLGLELAQSARQAGHDVTLLLGPGIVAPEGDAQCHVHRFTSTADLEQLLAAHFPACDVLVMAAAVADYRPVDSEPGKHQRAADASEHWTLALAPTPDLLAAVGRQKRESQRIVAFALEHPDDLAPRAAAKLRAKGADAIVANPLQTMEDEHIEPLWLTASGERETPGRMTKAGFAQWLLSRLGHL